MMRHRVPPLQWPTDCLSTALLLAAFAAVAVASAVAGVLFLAGTVRP